MTGYTKTYTNGLFDLYERPFTEHRDEQVTGAGVPHTGRREDVGGRNG